MSAVNALVPADQAQAVAKLNIGKIAVAGGAGFGMGYTVGYIEKAYKAGLAGTPLAPLLGQSPLGMDWVDALTYAAGAVAAVAPYVYGRRDLIITGPSFMAGKYACQHRLVPGLP